MPQRGTMRGIGMIEMSLAISASAGLTDKITPAPVASKFVLPRVTRGLIDRPRLHGLLAEAEAKRVTSIQAAAGYGKTSLAAGWAYGLAAAGHAVAWLSLDPEDDEPSRFFQYVAHSLGAARQGAGKATIALVSDVSLAPIPTILSTLITDLAEFDDELFLFLDDYHCISRKEIHDGLSYLIKRATDQFHLVITSREVLALPVASLRAQSRILEIDAASMRFDPEETRRFFAQEKIDIDRAETDVVLIRTEGWPAVLRIIASTVGGQRQKDYVRKISNLSRSAQPIGAYFDEVLATLPPQLSRFMIRTAILDRLCGSLCDAVTGLGTSGAMLREIESRQLLLVPLDAEFVWCRFHLLLRDHLRERLLKDHREDVADLHRRAADWFAANELWTEAIRHSLEAGDKERAIGWIDSSAMRIVKSGQLVTLLEWVNLFPDEIMRAALRVRLAIAWGMALATRTDEALCLVSDIEGQLSPAEQEIWHECQVVRATAVARQDDSAQGLALAKICLDQASDPWTKNVASNVVRFGLWKAGELEQFYTTPWRPYSEEEERANVFSSVYRHCLHGLVEQQQLRFETAERHYLEAARLAARHAGPDSAAAAMPASLMAWILYERDQLDQAEELLIDRMAQIEASTMVECVFRSYLVLTRLAAGRGKLERAHALLERAEELGVARRWGRLVAYALLDQLRLHLAEGRRDAASACGVRLRELAAEYRVASRCAWTRIRQYSELAVAWTAISEGRSQDSLPILRGLTMEASAARDSFISVRVSMDLAIALAACGKGNEAMVTLGELLEAAAPAGLRRSLLDRGPAMMDLLKRFRHRAGPLLSYVDGLISAAGNPTHDVSAPTGVGRLADTLSAREQEILSHIGRGQSNKEIARSLGIAPETVKSHVKNIFAKLSVEKRAQAVWRAQTLGLA
jgi:LuxR family maltose regulon positive regulatory protein